MITTLTQSQHFMGAQPNLDDAEWILVGMPYDGTCSYRPGTRFGPRAIREASWGVEMYSPVMDRELDHMNYADGGDLEFPFGNRLQVLHLIRQAARDVLNHGKGWIGMGGEHLVTLPVVEAYLEKYPDLAVVQFDAHADLRDDYLGEQLSHATVMRRIVDLIGPDRFAQIGIRSGTKEEFDWMRETGTLMRSHDHFQQRLAQWGNRPIFLTIDLDVLDPSIFPGTGTPEPGGLTFAEVQAWLVLMKRCNIVGLDAVELSPSYDASGVSNVVAAKLLREAMLLTLNDGATHPSQPALAVQTQA